MRLLLLASFMVAQRRRALIIVASVIAGLFGMVASCSKVPLLAPTGSVITLIPEANFVSLNSQVTIVATVIENGVATNGGSGSGTTTASRTGAGTPVQNGTHVTFTTTLGQIQPSDALTRNGEADVIFSSGGASGTATITAYSGGASQSIQLPIGTAAVGAVALTATPQTLPAAGGNTTLVANVTDNKGNQSAAYRSPSRRTRARSHRRRFSPTRAATRPRCCRRRSPRTSPRPPER